MFIQLSIKAFIIGQHDCSEVAQCPWAGTDPTDTRSIDCGKCPGKFNKTDSMTWEQAAEQCLGMPSKEYAESQLTRLIGE